MKKMLIAALLVMSSIVNAAEVTVATAELPIIQSFRSFAEARFFIDMESGQGYANVSVTEQREDYTPAPGGYYDPSTGRWIPAPGRMPQTIYVTVFSKKFAVEGLMLMGDKVIYHGVDGNVDCGTMGVSRVFKRPTLYLSGNCNLSADIVGNWNDSQVVVTLKTK